jgi:hypothetical protein
MDFAVLVTIALFSISSMGTYLGIEYLANAQFGQVPAFIKIAAMIPSAIVGILVGMIAFEIVA